MSGRESAALQGWQPSAISADLLWQPVQSVLPTLHMLMQAIAKKRPGKPQHPDVPSGTSDQHCGNSSQERSPPSSARISDNDTHHFSPPVCCVGFASTVMHVQICFKAQSGRVGDRKGACNSMKGEAQTLKLPLQSSTFCRGRVMDLQTR